MKKKQRSYSKVFMILIILIAIPVFGFLGLSTWYQDIVNSPASNDASSASVSVIDGQSLLNIADDLEKSGIIRSKLALQFYLRQQNLDPRIKVGSYEIRKNLTMAQVIEILEKGVYKPGIRITIKEGLRADEIASSLETQLKSQKTKYSKSTYLKIVQNPRDYKFETKVQTFLNKYKPVDKPLEGFLFPETYEIAEGATTQEIIEKQISTLIDRLTTDKVNLNGNGRLKSFYEVLTLATVVEREANLFVDRKNVADIFLKRLESGIGLGSDVTLNYHLKRWTPEPTAAELLLNTPYNTRIHLGLIPTPINSPSMESIKAVEYPTLNEYYFFIADAQGIMRYGKTLEEHSANIANYGLVTQ